jgi:capsular exopolysaccharide synthesis family protein
MNNEMMDFYEKEEQTNIREFILRLLSKWYWFVCFGVLGIIVAFVVTKRQPAIYELKATVLTQENSKAGGITDLFEGIDLSNKSKVQNHIGVLKSYTIVNAALKSLNYDVDWFVPSVFKDIPIYMKNGLSISDYDLKIDNAINMNPCNVPIRIKYLDDNKYIISVDEDYTSVGSSEVENIKFVSEGGFGIPFVNEYFSFTINKLKESKEKEYIFVFKDINKLTLDYQRKLSVSLMDKKSDIINLSIKGNLPAREVAFLNTLINEYSKFGLDIKNRTSVNMVHFIDKQMLGVLDSLEVAGKSFTSFRSENSTVNLGEEARLVVESVNKLETEYFKAKMRSDYYNNLSKYMSDPSKMQKMITPSVVGITDIGLNALVLRLAELYAKRGVMSSMAYDRNPTIIHIDKEIKQLRSSLTENLINLIANSDVELASIKERKTKLAVELKSLPAKEQALIDIKRNFDVNNELFTFLLKRRAESAITAASNVSDIELIDPARLETASLVGPKKIINMIVGFILGLGVPFVFFVIRDYFDNTIKSIEDIEKNSSIPLIGEITHSSSSTDLCVIENPRSALSESFRTLRTNLHYVLDKKDTKVIALHSMMPSEGKSFCGANLACILAMNGHKVLMIGCDLRRPRLHDLFDLNNIDGLSNILINDSSFEKVIQQSKQKNLSIICSGPIPPNPAELLSKKEFSNMMELAKKQFDYIILDNPPISLVTDGLITAKYADANLFVLRQMISKKEVLKHLNNKVAINMENVKFVFNDIKHDGIYSKYSKYSYGARYYADSSDCESSFFKFFRRNKS